MKPLILTALFFNVISVNAQTELSIGDPVPDITFQMLNYKTPTAKLSDFKGKPVILDFWSTWCSGCIEAFPKVDSLRSEYAGKLTILHVATKITGNTKEKLQKEMTSYYKRSGTRMHTAYNDTIAGTLFPHGGLPHIVWIGADGRVKAITYGKELNRSSINTLLSTGELVRKKKVDFMHNRIIPLGEQTRINDSTNYTIFYEGEIPGEQPIDQMRFLPLVEPVIPNGLCYRNVTLINMFGHVLNQLDSLPSGFVVGRDIIYEGTKAGKLYSYDMVRPTGHKQSIGKSAIQDINKLSGHFCRFELREMDCLIMTGTGRELSLVEKKNDTYLYSAPDVVGAANLELYSAHLGNTSLPVIRIFNDCTFANKFAVSYSCFADIEKLKVALANYDIHLTPGKRNFYVFVISEK